MEKIKSLIKTVEVVKDDLHISSYELREITELMCYIPLFNKPGYYTSFIFRNEVQNTFMKFKFDRFKYQIAKEIIDVHFKMEYTEIKSLYKMFYHDSEIEWEQRDLMLNKKDIMDCLKVLEYES